ncbi:hypothetical protein BU15DRAFT_66934 [Melanogaster broomeanus]|nr:hypothetical protein BU15DRAFT_66934 [Melanogaster broomeanus]
MSRPPGPSSVLISRIDHLSRLLESLPCTLPLDPPDSTYNFGLDTELVAEEGHWYAFNRNLEVCFETYKLRDGASIVFKERGSRYKALIQMFKITMKALTKDSERDFLREVWLERLISAAQLQGARIPARTEEEKAEQWKRLAKYSERDREIARVEEEVEKAERKEHRNSQDLTLLGKGHRTASDGGTRQERHSRTNWFHPFLWVHIDTIAPKVSWSASEIAKRLARSEPKLFSHLNKGTVQRWIDKDSKREWSPITKQNVERQCALGGSGQTGVLGKHPEIVKAISDTLRGLRDSRVPVSVVIARSIMISTIREWDAQLLEKFKCSEKFVRAFLASVLNWSARMGTSCSSASAS